MVPLIIFKAPFRTIFGIFDVFWAMSSTNSFRLLKGLSKTATFIPLFLDKYSKVVTAPIERPQRAILLIVG